MQFRLVTPEKVAFTADVSRVTVPTVTGEITILPGHVPLVSQLGSGELIVTDQTRDHSFAIAGGFLSIARGAVEVLAESADHEDEIDVQKAEEARARAEQLREKAQGVEEIAIASASLERALAQLKVAGRKRRHH